MHDQVDGWRQAKLTALVGERWGPPTGDSVARGRLPGGAFLAAGGRGWVLIDDGAISGFGAALAWALRAGIPFTGLDVVVEGSGPAGVVARRAAQFSLVPAVWQVDGRTLKPAEPAPAAMPRSGAGGDSEEHRQLAQLLEAHGVDPIVEHGVLRGEVLGLEVARARGQELVVGVGVHDAEARAEMRPGQPVGAALDEVTGVVRAHRRAGAARHPANTLARERWLRALVVGRPDIAGAIRLDPVANPVDRTDLRLPAPAGAVGEDAAGEPVVVVCTTGVDVDLVPTAADVRALHSTPEARLVLVVPDGDDYPVTHELASALKHPATVVTVPRDWADQLS